MLRLELPITIRTAREDEVPTNGEYLQKIKDAQVADISEGYKLTMLQNDDKPYKFFAQININNSKLWDLFIRLVDAIPSPAAFIYGFKDGVDRFSPYTEKEGIIQIIEKYKYELTVDGYLQFGFIHFHDDVLIEVYVDCSKYIKYWGVEIEKFNSIMRIFELKENNVLKFIDEFPKITEALRHFNQDVLDSETILENISRAVS